MNHEGITMTFLASWRRCRRGGLLLTAIAVLFVMPASAHAIAMPAPNDCQVSPITHVTTCYASASTQPGYRGWGRVLDCNGLQPTLIGCPSSVTAYRWTGGRWYATYQRVNQSVYVYPYGGAWRWAWTRESGWLAMRASDLAIEVGVATLATG